MSLVLEAIDRELSPSGVWLMEPDPTAKRLANAKSLLPGRAAGAETPGALRDELRAMRRSVVANLPALAQQALATWSSAGLRVHAAEDAGVALSIIRGLAGSTRNIAVNRSATASKELGSLLCAADFQLSHTYYLDHQNASLLERAFWQIPSLQSADVLGCYAKPRDLSSARRQARGNARDVVGLLGVAAAAASDGSLFLLQHLHNAADVFTNSREVVFVVGMDKLVPTAKDAMLQSRGMALFGAESTLLDLTPVGGFQQGPPLDSLPITHRSQDIHVILLDNGRSALRDDRYRDLLACIGCRACAVQCPTYRYYAGERRWSPKEYLWSNLRGENASVDLCVGCGMCLAQCPVGIDIPAMMARRKARRAVGIDRLVLSNFEASARISRLAPKLANAAMSNTILRRVAEPLVGLKAERSLPVFAEQTFAGWFARRARRPKLEKVAYYAGCTANYVEPAIGKAVVELLELAGLEVVFPEQVCCGMPQMANGRLQAARDNAAKNVQKLLAAGSDVVTACTSCSLAIKHEYVQALDISRAEQLAPRVFDAMEYVGRLQALGRLPDAQRRQDVAVLYHAPCHLKVRGGDLVQERLALMSKLPGVTSKEAGRGCCGMAGTFGSKCRGYAMSMEIGSPLFDEVKRADPGVVATDCPTCHIQLAQGTGRKVTHPIMLLWQAYGMDKDRPIGEHKIPKMVS